MEEERIDWPNGAKIALSIVVNVEEGSEMTVARGDQGMEPVDELGIHIKSPIRNYGNESNYLYGIKAGAPRVVKLLRDHDVAASWTVAALSLENHPEIGAAIRELGHEPVSHGWRWVHQFKMDEAAERDFIDKAVTIDRGDAPARGPMAGCRRYFHTDNTRRLLIEAGSTITWTIIRATCRSGIAPTVPGKPIAIVPYQLDTNDMKMWTDPAYTPANWLDYARRASTRPMREGMAGNPKMMSLGLHLRIIGRPGRIWAFEEFLRHVPRPRRRVDRDPRARSREHLASGRSGMTCGSEREGRVAHLLIDRAAKRNAITQAMWERFPALIGAGDGRRRASACWCSRAAEPGAFSRRGRHRRVRAQARAIPAWLAANQAAIHRRNSCSRARRSRRSRLSRAIASAAAAGSRSRATCASRRRHARFGITPAKLGLVYSLHDTKLLVDLVGPAQAKRILFTGALIDADEALRIGLIDMRSPTSRALVEAIAGSLAAHGARGEGDGPAHPRRAGARTTTDDQRAVRRERSRCPTSRKGWRRSSTSGSRCSER